MTRTQKNILPVSRSQTFNTKSVGGKGLETCPSWTRSAADIARRSAMSTTLTTAHYSVQCSTWNPDYDRNDAIVHSSRTGP